MTGDQIGHHTDGGVEEPLPAKELVSLQDGGHGEVGGQQKHPTMPSAAAKEAGILPAISFKRQENPKIPDHMAGDLWVCCCRERRGMVWEDFWHFLCPCLR